MLLLRRFKRSNPNRKNAPAIPPLYSIGKTGSSVRVSFRLLCNVHLSRRARDAQLRRVSGERRLLALMRRGEDRLIGGAFLTPCLKVTGSI
jgi:hypothetical protein